MKAFFYRNQVEKQSSMIKKVKHFRYSVDAPESSRPKPSRDTKKGHRKSSQEAIEKGRKQNVCPTKSKLQGSATAKNSLNATKSNSPFKATLTPSGIQASLLLSIKNYKFYYQIGLGAFGKVWKVADKLSGKDYALKEISKARVTQRSSASAVLNQRVILSKLTHPFVVNMQRAFQDGRNLYLLMDYMRGADLRYHICYKQHFSELQIKFVAACLLLALEYVHSKRIIHRDIKPQNIIFQENGYLRLTDFGIARINHTPTPQPPTESSGTPVYMAPEILFKRSYSYESDFYSLGVVLFELTMGRRPYQGKSRSEIREELMNKEICLGEFELPEGYSFELANLINKLLKKNPSERLGRNGVQEIKDHNFFKTMKWKKLQQKEMKPPYVPSVVSETQGYLSQISLFNQMNQEGKESAQTIDSDRNQWFCEYDFERKEGGMKKKGTKKVGRGSVGKIKA